MTAVERSSLRILQRLPHVYAYVRIIYCKNNIHSSREIEYFFETYYCKLCVILRSLVLLFVWPY